MTVDIKQYGNSMSEDPINENDWHTHANPDDGPLNSFALFPPKGTVVQNPISSVAIRWFGVDGEEILCRMIRPNRHHHLRDAIERSYANTLTQENSEMGFIDPRNGKFLSRQEAMTYVLEIGQIRKGFYWDEEEYDSLHSEDLWPDRDI